jgi:hypothetical protein
MINKKILKIVCSLAASTIKDTKKQSPVICNIEEKELQDLSGLVVNNRYNRSRTISPSLFVCWD